MWTITRIGLGWLGDMLLFHALFLLVPVEFVCEACVCWSWESTISQSKGDCFVDWKICLFYFEAPLVVTFFGRGRIKVVSGKTSCGNCSLICAFMLLLKNQSGGMLLKSRFFGIYNPKHVNNFWIVYFGRCFTLLLSIMEIKHGGLQVLTSFGFSNPKQVRIIKSEPKINLKEKK